MNVHGKVAVVTGASSGIGAATARALASEGARVVLVARRAAELKQVTDSIGPSAVSYALDLTKAPEVATVAARISAEVGPPDILVNNAGAGRWKFVDETTPDEAVAMMAAPYFATFNATHAFLPGMLQRHSGHIVNISSVGSRFVWPGATAYLAARWAVRGFTQALRADMTGTGIGVTLFEAGVVKSSYWEANPGSLERVPQMGRLVPALEPEQAAAAIVRGIRRNQKLVVVPFMMQIVYWQHAVLPGVVQWLMTRTGVRHPPS